MKKHATTLISRRQSVLTRLLPVLLLLLLPAVGGMTGCAEDDELTEPQNLYNVKGNEWIYEQMVHHYYWTDELPTKEKLNFNENMADFYEHLIYSGDRFSYYKRNGSYNGNLDQYLKQMPRCGVECQVYETPQGKTIARTLLVYPDSPMASVLRRGDWFTLSADGHTLTLLTLLPDATTISRESFPVSTPASRSSANSSVYLDTVYHIDGHRIGYMHYTSFDDIFPLISSLKRFHEADITEMILDLRYNGGGFVTTSIYLATAFVPDSLYGQPAQYLRYNKTVSMERFGSEDGYTVYNYCDASDMHNQSSHPRHIYFLVGRSTASASEGTINLIRPFVPSTLIGDRTVGKGIGMYDISDNNHPLTLVPITFRYYNNQWETVPDSGLVVDHYVPNGNSVSMKDMGRFDEPLLAAALEQILGYRPPVDSLATPPARRRSALPTLTEEEEAQAIRQLRPISSPSTYYPRQGFILPEENR